MQTSSWRWSKNTWTFIFADIKQPILGLDFLIHYNQIVDSRGRCLRDMQTGLAIHATLSTIKPLLLHSIDCIETNTQQLAQFLELTHPTTKGETVKHRITHKIVTKGHTVFVRPRRLAPDKLVTAKREFDEMSDLGVINPATVNGRRRSTWSQKERRLEAVWGLEV